MLNPKGKLAHAVRIVWFAAIFTLHSVAARRGTGVVAVSIFLTTGTADRPVFVESRGVGATQDTISFARTASLEA